MEVPQTKQADQSQCTTPFDEPDDVSDIVLVVDDKKLHLHRTVLILQSPVFKRMLLSDFKEKEAREIPLPGKKCDSFVKFLLQMYPVSSLEPITDEAIADILALADEYQVEHIRRKCEHFIESQLTSRGESLRTDQKLLYLWMCEVYGFKQHRDRLVDMAAKRDLQDLQKSQYYKLLPLTAIKDVMLKRCKSLEMTNRNLESAKADLSKENTNWEVHSQSEGEKYKQLRTSVANYQSSVKSFFSGWNVKDNCAKGERSDAHECNQPYNTTRYCKFCVKSKIETALLKPMRKL